MQHLENTAPVCPESDWIHRRWLDRLLLAAGIWATVPASLAANSLVSGPFGVDTKPPALTVGSPAEGQPLTTSPAAVSGTATDAGNGGGDVAVTVGGSAATGGVATGSASASWSKSVPLLPGPNTVVVEAVDKFGNRAVRNLTVHLGADVTPDTHAFVIGGTLAGQDLPGFTIGFGGATADYVDVELDALSSANAGRPPVEPSVAFFNRWRVPIPSTAQSCKIDNTTRAMGFLSVGGMPTHSVNYGLNNWPAARYKWKAIRTNQANPAAQGEFTLGVVRSRGQTGNLGIPALLVHGINSDEEIWTGAGGIAERLSTARPVYTMEYPNIGDIRDSAVLLGKALRAISERHFVNKSHVVAHSMGGVVARLYKQTDGAWLDRVFTLGSPFEGSEFASVGTPPARFSMQALALTRLNAVTLGSFPLNTVALRQLENPQRELGLYRNSQGGNPSDNGWLAACGTRVGLSIGANILKAIQLEARLQDAFLLNAKSPVSDPLFGTRSDGVVSWWSACKPALSERKNLYYDCNHLGYFNANDNDNYEEMISDISMFLASGIGTVSLECEPQVSMSVPVPTPLVMSSAGSVSVNLGRSIYYMYTENGDGTWDLLEVSDSKGALRPTGRIVTPCGRAAQGSSHSSPALAAATAVATKPLFVGGAGFLPARVGTVDTEGGLVLDAAQVALEPDPDWIGPRNPSIQIAGGTLSTSSSSVQIAVSCDGAAAFNVGEAGLAENWVPYTGGGQTLNYSFTNQLAALKTVYVQFRDAAGNLSAVASDEIWFAPTSGGTGAIQIADAHGGATVWLNGASIGPKTPCTLSGLAPGVYTVSLAQEGRTFSPSAEQITVVGGQTVSPAIVGSAPTRVATPLIFPYGGTISPNEVVTLSCATPGALIRYTLDGAEPTSASAQYSAPFTLAASNPVRAKAFKAGQTESPVNAATFTVDTGSVAEWPIQASHFEGLRRFGNTETDTWFPTQLMDGSSPIKDNDTSWAMLRSIRTDLLDHDTEVDATYHLVSGENNADQGFVGYATGFYHWNQPVGFVGLRFRGGEISLFNQTSGFTRAVGVYQPGQRLAVRMKVTATAFTAHIGGGAAVTMPVGGAQAWKIAISAADTNDGLVLHSVRTAQGSPSVPILLNAEGGDLNPSTFTVRHGSTYGNLPTSNRAGHVFGGWWTQAGGTGVQVQATSLVDNPFPHELHAKWIPLTYQLSYNANGANAGTVPPPQEKTHGQTVAIASNSGNLEKSGNIFSGWNTAASGAGADYAAGAAYAADASVSLYAKWRAVLVANDQFRDAFTVPAGGGQMTGTNVGATTQPAETEPDHTDGWVGGASVWWNWTPNFSGQASIDTQGSSFDTMLALYTGSSVDTLALVAVDDDGGENSTSRFTAPVSAGTVYRIGVYGYQGATGSIRLNVARITRLPTDGALLDSRRPTFQWPEIAGATWYEIYVSRDGRKVADEWIQGAAIWRPSADLPAGSYQWWLRGWGPFSGMSSWSAVANFAIEARIPAAVAQIGPAGAQTESTLDYRWTKDEAAVWYRVWSGRAAGGTFLDRWYNLTGPGTASVTVPGHPQGNFTWWIQGWSPDGLGPWAGPIAFSTPTADPAKPVLTAPFGTITSRTPNFQWNPAARAEWYRVYAISGTATVVDSWTQATQLTASTPLPSGTLSYWVASWNAVTKNQIWSDRLQFTIAP